MKVYKVTLLIIDLDQIGSEVIKDVLETTTYPNRCIMPDVMDIEGVEIGEWSDEHPLNNYLKREAYYNKFIK